MTCSQWSRIAGAVLLSAVLLAAPAAAQSGSDEPGSAPRGAPESAPGSAPGSQTEDQTEAQPDPRGELMTSEELRVMHSGKDLAGCYLERPEEPVWRERNGADGRLYDLMRGGKEVGRWWVEPGGVICFRYTDRTPGPHCFVGRRRGAYYDFYGAFDGVMVGTTQCLDPEIS